MDACCNLPHCKRRGRASLQSIQTVESGMHNLFVSAFHGTTSDPITQSQVLNIGHAGANWGEGREQALQLFAQLWGLRPHGSQPRNDPSVASLAKSFAAAQQVHQWLRVQ